MTADVQSYVYRRTVRPGVATSGISQTQGSIVGAEAVRGDRPAAGIRNESRMSVVGNDHPARGGLRIWNGAADDTQHSGLRRAVRGRCRLVWRAAESL